MANPVKPTAKDLEIKHLEEAKKTHEAHKAKRVGDGLDTTTQEVAITEIDARLAELKSKK